MTRRATVVVGLVRAGALCRVSDRIGRLAVVAAGLVWAGVLCYASDRVQVIGPVQMRNVTGEVMGVTVYGTTTTTGTPIVLPLDSATNTLQTIDYAHHEIHSGSHFNVVAYADLPITDVLDLQFVTPNTTKWAHLTWEFTTEAETLWFVYEDVVIVTSGTAVTPINNDRNSTKTSTCLLYSQINADTAAANADTDVSAATLLAAGIAGAGKTGGGNRNDNELILKANTKYAFRAVATTAGYISFQMTWYEHTNKN